MSNPESVWLVIRPDDMECFTNKDEADEWCDNDNLDVDEGFELAVVVEYVAKSRIDALLKRMREFPSPGQTWVKDGTACTVVRVSLWTAVGSVYYITEPHKTGDDPFCQSLYDWQAWSKGATLEPTT